MYTLNEVFDQAKLDLFSGNLDGSGYESRLVYGIKVSKDTHTGEVQLFNTTKGGSYYDKLSDDEVEIFLRKGWRCGVYVVFLSNNRARLKSIERSIRNEVNCGSTDHSKIKYWKVRRKRILQRYNNVNQLLINETK
tara:strand:- start:593 stop:1000 length:408 start_codon:yes stop_codon:yes gene_type:complete